MEQLHPRKERKNPSKDLLIQLIVLLFSMTHVLNSHKSSAGKLCSSAKSWRTWNDLTRLRKLLNCWYSSAEKKDPNMCHSEHGRPWFLTLSCLKNTGPDQIHHCRQNTGMMNVLCGSCWLSDLISVLHLFVFVCFCKISFEHREPVKY